MTIEELNGKTGGSSAKTNHSVSASFNEDGDIVLVIPGRISLASVKASANKGVPMVSLVPKADGGGMARFPITIFNEDGTETVKTLRLSTFNGFIQG